MAVPPATNYFNPDLVTYASNAIKTFSSDGDGTNCVAAVSYNGTASPNTIRIRAGRGSNVQSGNNTTVGTYTSDGLVTATLTKASNTYYVFFQFMTESSSNGYMRFTFTTSGGVPNGTYTLSMNLLLSTTKKIVAQIMIFSGTTTYDWGEMHSPIACSTDFSAGSSDATKSVILYDSSSGRGYANLSNGETLNCPLWNNLSYSYVNDQAIRYCDIKVSNVTAS